ncbi:MAG: TetR/AcrR family transcriptional regulator [Myxococcota bacterium]
MPKRAQRRPYQRGIETRTRLVEAALHEFSEKGFEGASTRSMAGRAGVAQSAVRHHFATKEALWRAAADHVFVPLRDQYEARVASLADVDERTRLRLVIRDLVRFAAAHPELLRLMVQEGIHPSARSRWLQERHLRPLLEALTAQWQALESEGLRLPAPPTLLQYMVIGASSVPYSVAGEYERFSGQDPFDKDAIEAHADAVVALFLPETTTEREAKR